MRLGVGVELMPSTPHESTAASTIPAAPPAETTHGDWVVLPLRIGLGALLLFAGILKAHDGPTATAATIAGYRLLPPAAVAPLGIALPYIEIVLGLYLVAGLFTRIVAIVASLQFAIFAAAVSSLVVRHLRADCGCFGSSLPTPPSWGHVAVDAVLAVSAAWVAWRAPGALAADRLLFPCRPLEPLER